MNEWIDGQEDTSRDERYVRRAFQDDYPTKKGKWIGMGITVMMMIDDDDDDDEDDDDDDKDDEISFR